MALKKRIYWDDRPLSPKLKRWSTSGGRPMPSPYPSPRTDPWDMESVLSIDGGGIRGFSCLVIMQTLMEKVGEIERGYDPKATSSIYSSALVPLNDDICAAPTPGATPIPGYRPCHYFDYIAGVGTGGIIATLLGRYRMSVGEAMEIYRNICITVGERQLTAPQPKLKRRVSVLSMNQLTSRQPYARTAKLGSAWPSPDECDGDLNSDPKRCRTIVCGCGSQMEPFRSYVNFGPRRHAIHDDILRCVRPNPPSGTYVDPKYIYNNPSRTVLAEIASLHANKSSKVDLNIDLNSDLKNDLDIDLLSIGCGISHRAEERKEDRTNELHNRMIKHLQLIHTELANKPGRKKFRLNDYRRIEALDPNDRFGLDVNDWTPAPTAHSPKFTQVEEAAKLHVQNPSTARTLRDVAEALVRKRRRRAETEGWERWTLGVKYRCPVYECHGRKQRFDYSSAYWAHLEGWHEKELEECTWEERTRLEAVGKTM